MPFFVINNNTLQIGSYQVGDTIRGNLLFGDGSVVECKIVRLDANISRDAFIVETPSGDHAVMLAQSVILEKSEQPLQPDSK